MDHNKVDNSNKPPEDAPSDCILPHIRWMIRRDMTEVLEIDKQSYLEHWDEEDYVLQIRQRNMVGMVAEDNTACGVPIVGLMVYSLHRGLYCIERFAVHGDYRRRGVGSAMMRKLLGKLSRDKPIARVWLESTNLVGNEFVRGHGFKCKKIAAKDRSALMFERGKDQ